MSKTPTRSKSVKSPWARGGVRGRDAEFPSEPIRVSDDALAKSEFDSSRRERNKILERPSTSGGPAAKNSMRKNIHGKGETKDDLLFNPLAANAFVSSPLPRGPPTPVTSPKSTSPEVQEVQPSPRSDTPDSLVNESMTTMHVHQSQPVGIGMALGSPSHPPNHSWQQQSILDPYSRTLSPKQDMSQEGWATPPSLSSKPKSSRWKTLGGIFGGGRKHSEPQAFYKVQPEASYQATVEAVGSNQEDALRGRARTHQEKKGEKKPDIARANTAPLNFNFHVDGAAGTPQITLDGGPERANPGRSQSYNTGGMLNVDIPTTQMERYSVMFGSVLQKPTSSTSASSLLARRQATLEKLKTVNEALALKERELEERAKLLRPRRATSPQPTKSPAFSLFPSTPSNPHRLAVRDPTPSPLQRSNTSPAALSPSRPSFHHSSDSGEMSATLAGPPPHIPIDPRPKKSSSRQHLTTTQGHIKKPSSVSENFEPAWTPENSQLSLDSPEIERQHSKIPMAVKPKLEEPTWQMIVPHSSTSTSSGFNSSRSDGHSTSTSASSISSSPQIAAPSPKQVHIQPAPTARRNRAATTTARPPNLAPSRRPSDTNLRRPSEVSNAAFGSPSPSALQLNKPSPSLPIDPEDAREERLKSAADISIARQISVSRQQRQLLVPIRKPSLKPHGGRSPIRVESPGSLGRGHLVPAAVKPATPTLVLAGNDIDRAWADSPVGQLRVSEAANRKSERVVLERVGN